ncbi:MAG: hypothetical protein ABSB96_06330 [Gaiellaceae bacterium]
MSCQLQLEVEAELEAEPRERRRWFGARREAVEEDQAKPEPESKRGFHLFRHAGEPEGDSDGGLDSTMEIPARKEAQAEARMQEPEIAPELAAGEMEARRPFSYRRHRERSEAPEEKTSSPADEQLEALEEDLGADRSVRRRPARRRGKAPGEAHPVEPSLEVEIEQADTAAAAPAAEATAEIELPRGISIREIEQTLDELKARQPSARRLRWRFRAEAIKDVEGHPSAADAELEEALRLENEFRLNAEQERRRREREYQRSLRT